MDARILDTDYLVVGCGAAGMAFTDALLPASDARVVMVDRRHAPGGHWLEAYPFVRLHMPSMFYGVGSLPLGNDGIDPDGLNQGLYERAGAPEICAYYERVMRERLLASGRVRYFPMCDYTGHHRFVSRVCGTRYRVRVRRRLVDATYLQPSVPASSPPPFEVAPEARCVPVGELTRVAGHTDGYVIVGAGKTAMDACLWLLEQGVAPQDLIWLKPREPWLLNRALLQGGELLVDAFDAMSRAVEASARARSVADYFERLMAAGWLLRIDERSPAAMIKGATVTRAELEQLRRIRNVVRRGHVRRIERDAIVLEDGRLPTSPRRLHVHCAAAGLNPAPGIPVFSDDRIVLQPIRFGFHCFSAAFAGYVEASRGDVAEKNRLCPPNPNPDVPLDFIRGMIVQSRAHAAWAQEPDVQEWLEGTRLNWFRGLPQHFGEPRMQQAGERLAAHEGPALANLERLLARATA